MILFTLHEDVILTDLQEEIMKEYKPFKSGKVREVYDAGDSIIMVATDRISAFDHILKNKITQKGQVLTQMSKFWFDLTADIVPNHMISVDNKDMPEFFQQEQFQGKKLFKGADRNAIAISVLKKRDSNDPNSVDAVTGATLTSNGVTDMLHDCLGQYVKFLNAK